MHGSFGATLRNLRKQRGHNLKAFAPLAGYSATHLGNIETGIRRPTLDVAIACDKALNCAPFLQALLSDEMGEPMLRRALLGGGLAVTIPMVFAFDGTAATANAAAYSLNVTTGADVDWDDVVARFAARHLLEASPQFAAELAAQLMVAQQAISAGDRDAIRGAALLSMIYGLWIADTGRIPTAHNMYGTAATLARTSGDPGTHALVLARTANRGAYEGMPRNQVTALTEQALTLAPAGAPAVEAYGALVHLAALTGDLPAGRKALTRMRAAAEQMPAADGPTARQRVAHFAVYLEGRCGTRDTVDTAFESAEHQLAHVPLWAADAHLYHALGMIRAGDEKAGITQALTAARTLPDVRILGVGVGDVLRAVKNRDTDDARELATHTAPGAAPWDTI